MAEQMRALRAEMFAAAENLDFERAAKLRDELKKLEALAGEDGAVDGAAFYDPYADAPKKRTASRSSRSTSGARAKAGSVGRGRYKR
jgi:excinuclease ABC subunit B